MSNAQSLIAEIESTLSNASSSEHSTILRRVTDLFLSGAQTYSHEHVAAFDDVIDHLVEKNGPPALIELSTRLAPISNAPAKVIGRLSRNDNIAIAAPVLGKSEVLTDEALIEIAKTKGPHHLSTIADRARISASVTTILVDRGSASVALKVVGNEAAYLSELGFVMLVDRARRDRNLAEALKNRKDFPPELQPFLNLSLA